MTIQLTRSQQLSDDTLVELTSEQKGTVTQKVTNAIGALKFIHELVERDELKVQNRFSVIRSVEMYLQELATTLGYDSDLKKEAQDRSADIRSANQEIRRLEALVGSERGLDGIAEKLSLLNQNFQDYWRKIMGMGIVYSHPGNSEKPGGWSGSYGTTEFFARLSTMIDNTGEGDVLGLEIAQNHPAVLDTPQNRQLIEDALQEKYPSLEIKSWEIVQCYGCDKRMQIRGLDICIQDIREME